MLTSLELEAAIDNDDVGALLDDTRSGACAKWCSSSYAHAPAISEWTTELFTDGGRRWIAIRGQVWSRKKERNPDLWRTTGVRWIDCRRRWVITADAFFRLGKPLITYKDSFDE